MTGAIREGYSAAVDTISPEYRVVGDFRFVKYTSFLMENWYPLHALACAPEGYYLRQYAFGDPDAEGILRALRGQPEKKMREYFKLD